MQKPVKAHFIQPPREEVIKTLKQMDRLNEHKVGARQREKHTERRVGNKKSCGFNDGGGGEMFNVQMKLKINEREATEFWMRFVRGLRLVREKRGERLGFQREEVFIVQTCDGNSGRVEVSVAIRQIFSVTS
jgi:hypothetical protein